MNGRTEQEFKTFLETMYGTKEINYRVFSSTHVCFDVVQMYSFVDTSFETLCKISEFFDTKKINLNNWSSAGCETCDYGSMYAVQFDIYREA